MTQPTEGRIETYHGLPRLNERAPEFDAMTTHGPRRLGDYEGKWLLLFSHPADFTPVCTTEFVEFAKHHADFRKLNCELLGLSIDSKYSHIAWVRNIKEKFGIEIQYPVIDDVSMEVARSYGMIHPGAATTSTVRTVFVIDEKGILRAMLYYPMTNGRSVVELLRLVSALQATDRTGMATPAEWKPGDKVIVPTPTTQDMAEKRMKEGYECVDWYFCKADLGQKGVKKTA